MLLASLHPCILHTAGRHHLVANACALTALKATRMASVNVVSDVSDLNEPSVHVEVIMQTLLPWNVQLV